GPALAIQFRHARGRRPLPRHIRQDIQQRLPVPGRLFELEAQAPTPVHPAVGIAKTHPLLGDVPCGEAVLRPEWAHKLTGQTLMLPNDEKGAVAIELSEKL